MPRFRFAVKDEWGRRKTGGIDAPDLKGARKRLVQGGFEVISVHPEGQALPEGEERSPAMRPPSRRLLSVGAVLLGLGCTTAVLGWLRQPAPQAAVAQPLRLVFEGKVQGKCRRVALDVPELPFHQEATLENGHYRILLDMKAGSRPTYAWIQAVPEVASSPLSLSAESAEQSGRKRVLLSSQQPEYSVADLKI